MDSESFYIIILFQQDQPALPLTCARSRSPSSPRSLHHSTLAPSLPLAKYLSGDKEAVEALDELLAEQGEQGLQEDEEGRSVRCVVGTVWILEGEERREEGVEVLREADELGKDQQCLALLSHLYISLSLASLSSPLLSSPSVTSFTSDSLLSQLLQARTHLATGPARKWQASKRASGYGYPPCVFA
ncbi:hypothetical protein JCM5296_002331 [Sporobolomyces johnsonii]